VAGRRVDVAVLPLAYISKVTNISAVADLFEEVDFVALDEAHNLLTMVEVRDDELYSRRYCSDAGGQMMCLALPLVGELVGGVKRLLAASASILRHFSHIFTYFLRADYVEVSALPGAENLEVEYMPLEVRYRTRTKRKYVEIITDAVRRVYQEYRRVVVFFPSRDLAEFYASKLTDLPVAEHPLGDIDHVIVTYYGSPVSEGVNLDVKAGVLVGFPIPDIKSRELWLKVSVLRQLGFDGYKYAVLFAAVNNVVQAAGRVLRNLTRERKLILLIDDRFLEYRHLLPHYLSQALK
jgi:Rad3-related DNA helicases